MTAVKNQQRHEAELFTRILARMARLTESVEGLNEEMEELRKVLDGMSDNEMGVKYDESRKFVYSIHPGACLNREPGCDGDPVWSVVRHLKGPRISGSESTSWRMAWVYAAEILKADRDGFAQSPECPANLVTHEDMVKDVHPLAGVVEEWNSLNGRRIRCVTVDGNLGSEMLSGWVTGGCDPWENAASRITEAHRSRVCEKYPSATSCVKRNAGESHGVHEVWSGVALDEVRSKFTFLGSGQSEFAAWFAAARNCGLASEPTGKAREPVGVWSSRPFESDGWHWFVADGIFKGGSPRMVYAHAEDCTIDIHNVVVVHRSVSVTSLTNPKFMKVAQPS